MTALPRRSLPVALAASFALAAVLGSTPVRAEIIYTGESLPGLGTCPDGDISWAMDAEQGRVIRVHAIDRAGQPSERCEFVTVQEDHLRRR
jgi:hypothetical protein